MSYYTADGSKCRWHHKNFHIEETGKLAGEFMDEVDFPDFGRGLLKGVFDANLDVTVKQMEEY